MKFRLEIVFLFCAVGWSAVRANDPGVWEALGPDGASGAVVRFHPSQPGVLFAGTTAGVYRSADGGSHWSFSGRGMGTTWASALEIAPSNPRALYAGTADRGVFRSADGGESWVAWNEGLDDLTVAALGIDPNRDDVVFLGTSSEALYRRVGSRWSGMVPTGSGSVSPGQRTASGKKSPSDRGPCRSSISRRSGPNGRGSRGISGLSVTVEAFDSRGNLSAARRITIPYGGRFVGLLDDPRLFGSGFEQNGGRLVIRTSRAVTVLSFYGGTGFLASAPATGTTGEE